MPETNPVLLNEFNPLLQLTLSKFPTLKIGQREKNAYDGPLGADNRGDAGRFLALLHDDLEQMKRNFSAEYLLANRVVHLPDGTNLDQFVTELHAKILAYRFANDEYDRYAGEEKGVLSELIQAKCNADSVQRENLLTELSTKAQKPGALTAMATFITDADTKEEAKTAIQTVLKITTTDPETDKLFGEMQFAKLQQAVASNAPLLALIEEKKNRPLVLNKLKGMAGTQIAREINKLQTPNSDTDFAQALDAIGLEIPAMQKDAVVPPLMREALFEGFLKGLPKPPTVVEQLLGSQKATVLAKIAQGPTPPTSQAIQNLFKDLVDVTKTSQNIANTMAALGLQNVAQAADVATADMIFADNHYPLMFDDQKCTTFPLLKDIVRNIKASENSHARHIKTIKLLEHNQVIAQFSILSDAEKSKTDIQAAMQSLGLDATRTPALFAEIQFKRILDAQPAGSYLKTRMEVPETALAIKEKIATLDRPTEVTALFTTLENANEKTEIKGALDALRIDAAQTNEFFGRKQLKRLKTIAGTKQELLEQMNLNTNEGTLIARLGNFNDSNAINSAFARLQDPQTPYAALRGSLREQFGLLPDPADEKLPKKLYAANQSASLLAAVEADGRAENFRTHVSTSAEATAWLTRIITDLNSGAAYTALIREIDPASLSPTVIAELQTKITARKTHHAAANIGAVVNERLPADTHPALTLFLDNAQGVDPAGGAAPAAPSVAFNKQALMENNHAKLDALLASKTYNELVNKAKAAGLVYNADSEALLQNLFVEMRCNEENATLQNPVLAKFLRENAIVLDKETIAFLNDEFIKAANANPVAQRAADVHTLITTTIPSVSAGMSKLNPKNPGAKRPLTSEELETVKGDLLLLEPTISDELLANPNKARIQALFNNILENYKTKVGSKALVNLLLSMNPTQPIENGDVNLIIGAINNAASNDYNAFLARASTPGALATALNKFGNWKSHLTEAQFNHLKQRYLAQQALDKAKSGPNPEHEFITHLNKDIDALEDQKEDLGGKKRRFWTHKKGTYDSLAVPSDILEKVGAITEMDWMDPEFQASAKLFANAIRSKVDDLDKRCNLMLDAYNNDLLEIQKSLNSLPTEREAEFCELSQEQKKKLNDHRKNLLEREDFLKGEISKYQKVRYVLKGDPSELEKESFKGLGLIESIKKAEEGKFIKVKGTSWQCISVTQERMDASLQSLREINADGERKVSAEDQAALTAYNPEEKENKAPPRTLVAVNRNNVPTSNRKRDAQNYIVGPKPAPVAGSSSEGPFMILVGGEEDPAHPDKGFFFVKESKDGSTVTVTGGKLPKTAEEQVRYALLQAEMLLRNTKPGSKPKLEIYGGTDLERKCLWTALMHLRKIKGMEFGQKNIDLGGEDFSGKLGGIKDNDPVSQMFADKIDLVKNSQLAMQEFVNRRKEAANKLAGIVEHGEADEKSEEKIKQKDVSKAFSNLFKSKNKHNKQEIEAKKEMEKNLDEKTKEEAKVAHLPTSLAYR